MQISDVLSLDEVDDVFQRHASLGQFQVHCERLLVLSARNCRTPNSISSI